MTKPQPLLYLPAMFATCMLLQVSFVLCVALWSIFPDLKGHELLTYVFPGFKMLNVISFIYGLMASALYGWFVAVVFVFFHNLWPTVAHIVYGCEVRRA